MASVFVRTRIADYGKWKPIFDEHEATRKKFGFKGHSLHRDADDPNVIVIAFRVGDIRKAREFAASDDLRATMMRAGVEGPPEMWFCEDIEGYLDRTMLRTRFTKLFALDYPIMSAPMAMHSGGHLAAAVSKAGALGSFGGIQPERGADWLRAEIAYIRSQTDRDFAVGFITHLIPIFRPMFDAALEERVPVIAFSFADPAPYVARAKQSGARVVCQVQSLKHARESVAAGADVLVAQGNEAGGHTGTMNLLPLLVSIIDAYPDIPVLAAGGITSGRALSAVLVAGADGAWLGTALLATPECIEVTDAYKDAIVESAGEDTVYTSVLDVITVKMFGIPPWPDGIAERVRREPIVDQWTGREAELRASPEVAVKQFTEGRARGDQTVLMGQGAGLVKSVRPAGEVIREMCEDAERILREHVPALLG